MLWCNVSHCLIWHSAATQLLGFVTFCGPSAPVPPIVPEFSIFGQKLDSLNLCVDHCQSESNKLHNLQGCFLVFSSAVSQFCFALFFSDDNRRKHHSTREDCEAFLTRAFKCHAVPLHVIDTSRCQKCKLSRLSSAGEIKKRSKVNRYLGLTFNCSDM